MITEKHFATSHAAFWRELLPMASSYIHKCNLRAERFDAPLESSLNPNERGIINEAAFQIFDAAVRLSTSPYELSNDVLNECIRMALRHIRFMRQYYRQEIQPPDERGLAEALSLSQRIVRFCATVGLTNPILFPAFPGCGWLDSCHADLLGQKILFEIKAGDRGFHGSDLRQILTYCALNFSAKAYDIEDVCLANPRTGKFFSESVEKLCERLAGRSAVYVLSDIVTYVSAPQAVDV